nr:hypothetical protein [Tanacetum cinerariifolium]
MGGGFYDRSLAYQARRKAWQKPVLLGLAHECQKVGKLAVASWDVPLQGTVSDKRWFAKTWPSPLGRRSQLPGPQFSARDGSGRRILLLSLQLPGAGHRGHRQN